ncbi:MAG: hypothetical protein K2X93_12525 [Candidatus Obscuribacterales bacterium]|nr:hypothetical protein [Candidatus Obscuribacterales bacterium]
MGDLRQTEAAKPQQQPTENNSTGIERATDMMLDQFLRGDFNLGRNARPLLSEAGQLNTMTLTDDDKRSELSVRTNLYTLGTRMEYKNPNLNVTFNFLPATGWDNPFRRPTYDLAAQTADRSTMLNVSSKDGAAPDIQFSHVRDGLSLRYTRSPLENKLNFSVERQSLTSPVQLDVGHDFRRHTTNLGLTGQVGPYSQFGVGGGLGPRNYYDVNVYLRLGGK